MPLPVPISVSVPMVLPQLMVRPSFCDSEYASSPVPGPVIFRVVTVAPVASPALSPTL